jgi:hypothetical protein
MKKKKDTVNINKQKILRLRDRIITLEKKVKENPYYYNQHPKECVIPLVDVIGEFLTEALNQVNDDKSVVYVW